MTKSCIYLIDFITEYWSGDIIINPKEEQYNIDFLEEKTKKARDSGYPLPVKSSVPIMRILM